MTIYLICALVTFISATVSLGFSVDAVIKSKSKAVGTLINAKYSLSRSLSIWVVAIGLFVFQSTELLVAMALIMIFIQLFDGIIGTRISFFKTIGPLVTALFNGIVLFILLR